MIVSTSATPLGLARPEASFAIILLRAMPIEDVRPSSDFTAAVKVL